MFEMGNAPAAHWDPAVAQMLVDVLIRDILIGQTLRIRAIGMARDFAQAGRHFINWVPDTWTILQLRRLTGDDLE